MGFIDSGSKSSRLLASRRYTHNTYTTAQESFTNVLDLREEEIYTQAQYIPSSGLPYSGSSQHGFTQSASGSNVMKYWYRHKLTPSNVNDEVWFFLNPTGSDSGIGAQLIDDNQQTSFISPKYSVASLANSTTEDATPGYGVVAYKSSTYTQASQTGSLGSGDKISGNDYIFDYKTGVLQFLSSAHDPASNEVVFLTAYQYVGRTLKTGLDVQGAIAASYFAGDGAGLTGLSSEEVSVAFADITGKPVLHSGSLQVVESLPSGTVSSSAQIADDISGSFNAGFTASGTISGSTVSGDSITSIGTISGSAVYGTTIGQNRVDGVKTITIEANSTVNQDLTTDANVQFNHITASGNISSSGTVYADNFQSTGGSVDGISFTDDINITGNMTASGDISGSATSTGSFGAITMGEVIGNWTNAGNTIVDLGTVSAATSITATDLIGTNVDGIIGADTARAGTFAAIIGTSLTSTGIVSGSAIYGTTIGQNRTDGLKTITIEANSTVNQDLTTDANPTFADLTLTGDLTVRGDTTTLSTTNLKVQDAFVFAATGSAASNVDGGLIVQSGSAADSGSAIYHDIQDERWAVGKGVASDGTAVTPTAYVTTTTTANHNPNTDSGSYGSGEMWVNTTDEEIWVRTG